MKITVLTPDMSHNCLSRAYALAEMLRRRHDVEIAGPIFGEGIWPPLANGGSIPYKTVKVRGSFTSAQVLALRRQVEGDVVYASKPRFPSFGLGVLLKIARRVPLVLDMDDWERGFILEDRRISRPRDLRSALSDAVYDVTVSVNEALPGLADRLTVANTFLQRRFGGTLVWHARDTEAFRPDRFSREDVREEHGIEPDERVVMFSGSPGPYKGVEELIDSVRRIPDPRVTLALVGIPDGTPFGVHLREIGGTLGRRFHGFGRQPFDKMPEFLAMADLVVIPQRRSYATIGQVPAKVFEAMAMAKPILATAVSDLPYILPDCGWVIEPGDVEEMSRAIQAILADEDTAIRTGARAREKCVREFSRDAMEPVLVEVFRRYE